MRNLKRALSLALASVMLMGMMVVGTSAASTSNFTDADKISNAEAVDLTTVWTSSRVTPMVLLAPRRPLLVLRLPS